MKVKNADEFYAMPLTEYQERRRYEVLRAAAQMYGTHGMGLKDSVQTALAMLAEIQRLESGEGE